MSSRAWCLGMVVVIAGYVSGPACHANEAEKAVASATEAYTQAFNSGEAARFAKFWAEEADYTTSAGELYKGRAAIQALMATDADAVKGSSLKIVETTQRALKDDVVLQDGVLEFHGADGLIERSRYTAVWVKFEAGWQLASVRDLGGLETLVEPEVAVHPLQPLNSLVGQWATQEGDLKIDLTVAWKLDEQFLQLDYVVTPKKEGADKLTVLQLVGWDPVDGVIRSWFFDSAGGHGSGVWDVTDKGWSVLSSGVTPTGQLGGGEYLYDVEGSTLTFSLKNREVAGEALPDMTLKFAKQ
jgi:uncharacterized protein (TIGR02246 family)